jgi:hypothetical protein
MVLTLALALTISIRTSDILASGFGIAAAHSRKTGQQGRA